MPPNPQQVAFESRKRALFEAVKDLPEQQRANAISLGCAGDPELAHSVWKLLRASRPDSDGILNRPAYERKPAGKLHPKTIGQYAVEGYVGSGGMGDIYHCRHTHTGAMVAVKIIRSDILNPAALERFRHERDILMQLDHPNICRIVDGHVADQGTPFIVMEYVDGKPLDEYCRQTGSGLQEKLLLLSQVLAGVDYLHSQNIVHRDLKPSNLLVTRRGRVKILDFGLAKIIDHAKGQTGHDRTATKVPFMTLRYASPEQLGGTLSGRASDIYALGLIGYELVTGKIQSARCSEQNPQALLRTLKEVPLLPPSRVAPNDGITRSIDNLILNALHFSPENRYRSIGLFHSDLRRCVEGGTVPLRYTIERSAHA